VNWNSIFSGWTDWIEVDHNAIFSCSNDWIGWIRIQYSVVGIIGLGESDSMFNSGNDQTGPVVIEYSLVEQLDEADWN